MDSRYCVAVSVLTFPLLPSALLLSIDELVLAQEAHVLKRPSRILTIVYVVGISLRSGRVVWISWWWSGAASIGAVFPNF